MRRISIMCFLVGLLNASPLEILIDKLAKPFDLAKSIKAIAKVESDFGKYKINIMDKPYGSCGLTHINLKTYMDRHKIKKTNFNINKACSDLVNNDELAIANAIEELLYWKEQICKGKTCTKMQWMYVYSAYNAGWNYRGKAGLAYANKILKELK